MSPKVATGTERTDSYARLTAIRLTSWNSARMGNERPTSVMKNEATVIDPSTIPT